MTEDNPIRVMIVDDHVMMRTGLKYTLQNFDDLTFTGEASSGGEAVALVAEFQPDVILMDMVMPGMDGAQATLLIRERHPETQILILTSFHEQDQVEKALQAGAIGYLLKNVTADILAQSIRAAAQGQPTLGQEATEALIQSTRQKVGLGHDLSNREREVLALMAEGLTNEQIAESLTISTSTVKFHVGNILSKLGTSNRVEAVNLTWQHNLLKGSNSN